MKPVQFFRSVLGALDPRPRPPGTLCPDPIRMGKGAGLRWNKKVPLDKFIRKHGLCGQNEPIRVHLGCGQKPFAGYVNVDYPPESHHVMHDLAADILADISLLRCRPGSLGEIRLHHVFEHFDRIHGLAMLGKFARWLKLGGRLILETPDLEGTARTFLQTGDHKIRMAMARHLAGDQSSPWGAHLEHWWPDRYRKTLNHLGFKVDKAKSERWRNWPYLSNAVVIATLERRMNFEKLKISLKNILRQSMINESEEGTYQAWERKLKRLLKPQ